MHCYNWIEFVWPARELSTRILYHLGTRWLIQHLFLMSFSGLSSFDFGQKSISSLWLVACTRGRSIEMGALYRIMRFIALISCSIFFSVQPLPQKRKYVFHLRKIFIIRIKWFSNNWPFLTSFLFSTFLQTVDSKLLNKSCRRLNSNPGPLASEATALSTVPQSLPYQIIFYSVIYGTLHRTRTINQSVKYLPKWGDFSIDYYTVQNNFQDRSNLSKVSYKILPKEFVFNGKHFCQSSEGKYFTKIINAAVIIKVWSMSSKYFIQFRQEPWFCGYGRKVNFEKSWVQILARDKRRNT